MVGDSARDIACALRAGCGRALLVRTGNGRETEAHGNWGAYAPHGIVDDLWAAVPAILDFLGP